MVIRLKKFRFLLWLAAALLAPPLISAENDHAPDELRTAAEKGDAAAQYKLGMEFFYGTDQRKANRDLATFWFRRAAANGLPQAQFNYAICLEHGLGISPDPQMALEYYTFAAEKGIKPAAMNRAMLLLLGSDKKLDLPPEKKVEPDRDAAMEQLRKLADQDFAPAMVEIAAVELAGTNLSAETQKHAFDLLFRASKLPGVTNKGLRLLADCYYGAIGTQQDGAKTLEFLRIAAKRNDVESMAKLAFFYENGELVQQDRKKAFNLHKRAAQAGLALSQYKYAEYICEGFEDGMGLDHAMEWYRKACDQDCPQAFHRLGLFALDGIGMNAPDRRRGAELFLHSAKLGYAPSQYSLACMFADGDGIPQNDEKALFWFTQAGFRGHAAAMRRVGLCYLNGIGCKKDMEKASVWLNAAADNGDVAAQQMLESGSQSPW